MKLSGSNLSQLPTHIKRPQYDRSCLTAGILHIGVGNYHRAHQSWYMHRLFERNQALDWAIIGAGVKPYDAQQRAKLEAQDWLTCLIERDSDGVAAQIVGSMIDFVNVRPDNKALIDRMSQPDIKIVSMTLTEGGYYIDPSTGGFDDAHPDIKHDIANHERPITAFGAIIAALKKRRDNNVGPFTCLCCDNLESNGAVLRQTVISLAERIEPDLANWIDKNCTFPNSMVDGIVPATGKDVLKLSEELGIEDNAPVAHERFRAWVIEDDFCAGRPPLEDVGVIFSDRVHDYESMKIRILNAGHQFLANAGEIMSLDMIADCMLHKDLRAFFSNVLENEVLAHVAGVQHMSPEEYLDTVITRFNNAEIRDTTRRVAFDGSSRHTGFVHPIIRDAIDKNTSTSGLALAEALWARMCYGTREDGSVIEKNDPIWDELVSMARLAKEQPSVWLAQEQIYGSLAEDKNFAKHFEHWLEMLWSDGTAATLIAYNDKRWPH